MKIRTLFSVLAILLSLNVALAKNELDDPEVGAAIAVLDARNDIESNYQFCRARAGDYGYKYDYVRYFWDLKNKAYIDVSDKIFNALPGSSSSGIKQRWKSGSETLLSARSTNNNENGKYCSQYFSQLTNGSTHDLSVSRPKLAPKLGAPEEVRIIERNLDMEVGCVKAGYNNDVKEFEGIRKACTCQTALIVKKMSDTEIDDYLSLVARKSSQDAAAFIAKRLSISELQACYSSIGSR